MVVETNVLVPNVIIMNSILINWRNFYEFDN